jgi:hypothetical protein
MNGFQRIDTSVEVNQFMALWTGINQTSLTDQEDAIQWRFTANGSYSTKSAYVIQFAGSYPEYEWNKMWTAKAENKCKFFS